MLRRLTIIVIATAALLSCITASSRAANATLDVHAGDHARLNTPIVWPLPDKLARDKHFVLIHTINE